MNYLDDINGLNKIESSTKIGREVELGENNYIGHNVVIQGNVVIGNNNYIASGTIIGGEPRLVIKPEKWELCNREEKSSIVIGDNNLIFENVNIHAPSIKNTIIENNVSIGAFCHVGHDSLIKSGAILSTNILIGGYVIIESMANLGLGVRIHPRSVIGQYSMCGMGAVVKGYVFPSTLVAGIPAKFKKFNEIGLDRFEVSEIFRKELYNYYNYNISPHTVEVKQILEIFFKDCDLHKKPSLNLDIL